MTSVCSFRVLDKANGAGNDAFSSYVVEKATASTLSSTMPNDDIREEPSRTADSAEGFDLDPVKTAAIGPTITTFLHETLKLCMDAVAAKLSRC
ncbi:uncharacterized protein EV420DRAFT_1649920 [Desarmillaria tabescens]|uniref:Uncharacterized protein n=1 Tax=Armillaria tabescens TaxID=1929756 RepID=A0AA39JGR7_ARMTA|nr:uncharacterized protein EV420DRAFT_1649920 [Desarmillaria tabescens]KAK0441807.1 hypothetical protein EV420DRAFT_1649920 [Desarmillaria tabescens]